MPECCIHDDLMYHFIINNSNKMKEPIEVKQMKTVIEKVYNDKVKQNFKKATALYFFTKSFFVFYSEPIRLIKW
jgi:hypothetical protein